MNGPFAKSTTVAVRPTGDETFFIRALDTVREHIAPGVGDPVAVPTKGFGIARVTNTYEETSECRSFEFDVHERMLKPEPGQFVRVRITIDGTEHERCYAVSSLVARGERLRITVKRVKGGIVSNWCHRHLDIGMGIEMGCPEGSFTLRNVAAPIVFVAGGVGIAPVFPLMKHALTVTAHPIALMTVQRSESERLFWSEIDQLKREYRSRLILDERFTRDEAPSAEALPLALGELTARFPEAANACAYICGPESFSVHARAAALSAGIQRERIFSNLEVRCS